MKSLFCFLLFFIPVITYSQANQTSIAIIPEPVLIEKKSGEFQLPAQLTVQASSEASLKPVLDELAEKFKPATGRTPVVSNNNAGAAIKLIINPTRDAALGKEGYRLSVTPRDIQIKANEPAGLFYGIQTLVQLFPKAIERNKPVANVEWKAPCVEITDYPRFQWRGLMFDVSRHFFTKADVKQFIDDMVKFKFNLLHMHLTDDEGWRIEIKSYPKLTEVGAWNVKKVGYFGNFTPPTADEPRDYGGFYTQEDIKEIVQYASDRFVNILPEIDVPGHSLAAVVSYPELSCTPGANKYRVRSGEQIMDWSRGAPPIALVDNTLCPANEKVYEFLDKVVTEVAALFPFEYLHMGGDECPKNFWEKNPQIKALMKKENLKRMEQVQSYFTKRLEKIVASKGKKFMGWDEILEGGLAPNAAVMSWRGLKGGIEAAHMGHEVVMSPTTYAYLDYMQGDVAIEPRIYASLRLNKAYEFEPLPEGVDAKYIKGGQGNLWTEQIYNMRHLQYMLWPRALAVAESVWSQKEKKNWKHFFSRVEKHFERFDEAEIKYAPSVYEPIINITKGKDNKAKIEIDKEVDVVDVYYTWDNSFPDRYYPKYTEPLTPPKDAAMLKLISYKGNEQVGRLITIPIEEINKRANIKK
jgi:hexosaminidase